MRFSLPASRRWPLLVITALAAQMGFGVWMMRVAGSDPNFAIEPDYYARAVHWDARMEQARRDLALGWRAVATLTRSAGQPTSLVVSVVDSLGAPLVIDSLRADVLPVAHASRTRTLTLARVGEKWEAQLRDAETGLWETNIRAWRGRDVFTARVRPELR